jgi:hypothetical protein
MKKYRSLWWMSTRNHNILYFVNIPGIHFPNKGNCLWKAAEVQAGRGMAALNLLEYGAKRPSPQPLCLPI